MGQIFRSRADTIARVLLASVAALPVLLVGLAYSVMRSPYVTGQNVTREQPVPFSHEHHLREPRYRMSLLPHLGRETRFAGIPPTETCMTCHSQIWTNAGVLAPVRHEPRREQAVSAGGASITCRTTSTSITAYTSPKASVAQPATAPWTECRSCAKPRRSPWAGVSIAIAIPHRTCVRVRVSSTWPGRRPRTKPRQGHRLLSEYHINTKHLTDCSVCHR